MEQDGDINPIIQIGAVKFDDTSGKIIDKFCRFIKLGKPLSDFIHNLTGIKNSDLEAGISLHQAYLDLTDFTSDCDSLQPIVWGNGDMWELKKQLMSSPQTCILYSGQELHHNEHIISSNTTDSSIKFNTVYPKWIYGYRIMDVKTIHQFIAPARKMSARGGLSKTMSKYNIPFLGTTHDAVNDAYNTAILYMELKKLIIKS